jgi:hypothetical protein
MPTAAEVPRRGRRRNQRACMPQPAVRGASDGGAGAFGWLREHHRLDPIARRRAWPRHAGRLRNVGSAPATCRPVRPRRLAILREVRRHDPCWCQWPNSGVDPAEAAEQSCDLLGQRSARGSGGPLHAVPAGTGSLERIRRRVLHALANCVYHSRCEDRPTFNDDSSQHRPGLHAPRGSSIARWCASIAGRAVLARTTPLGGRRPRACQ